jgi:xanthine dehydrogenase FAD-binding subunit
VLSYDHYVTPTSLAQAFDALEGLPGARIVAGATDLLPWAREGRAGDVHLGALVDVSRLPELLGVSLAAQAPGRLRMGAATVIAAFEQNRLLRQQAPVLAQCAAWFADDADPRAGHRGRQPDQRLACRRHACRRCWR